MIVKANIELKNNIVIPITVKTYNNDHLKFTECNNTHPSHYLWDYYLNYCPELINYGGDDFRMAIIKNVEVLEY